MTQKSKKETPKKETSKKAALPEKLEKMQDEKLEKKGLKMSEREMSAPTELETSPAESEDIEDAEEISAGEGGGNAAALAAATSGTSEISASFKNFRHHPDMENFYRFIFDNDLRQEALTIIDEIISDKQNRKTVKGIKAQPH